MNDEQARTGGRSRLHLALRVAIGISLIIGLPLTIASTLALQQSSCVATPTLDVELGDRIFVIPRHWEIVWADGKNIPYADWIGRYKRPCFRAGDLPLQPYTAVLQNGRKVLSSLGLPTPPTARVPMCREFPLCP